MHQRPILLFFRKLHNFDFRCTELATNKTYRIKSKNVGKQQILSEKAIKVVKDLSNLKRKLKSCGSICTGDVKKNLN